ncbi:unnamed protein product [Ascophyllum nodosum]
MPQARAKRTALVAFTFAFGAHSGSGWAIRSSSIRSTKVPSLHSCMSNSRRVTSTCRNRLVPTCELERLPRQTLKRLVPICPTMEKWLAHYGQTATERQRRVVNGIGTSFVLYWLAFFASRTLIGPFAWRVSSILVFLQAFLWPVLESFRHTLELWGEGSRVERRRTKGALFTGRVTRTGFALASEASHHRTHFQMLVEDDEGRELFFDVPQVPDYRNVRRGMQCEVVVLSRSPGFSKLTGVTDAYIADLDMFVGRYPLLNKSAFWKLLDARKEGDKRERGTAQAHRARRGHHEFSTKLARDRPGSVPITEDEHFDNQVPVYDYQRRAAWKNGRDQLDIQRGSRL